MSTHSRIREVFIGEHMHTIPRRHKIKRSEYLVTGRVPVVDQGQEFIAGYIDDEGRAYEGPLPVILFGDHTCTLKYVDFSFALGADGTQLICPTSDFDIRYFYYSLHSLGLEHFGYERHFKYLKEKKILWRPMEDQRKIAAVLSTYDDLIENNTHRIRTLEEMTQMIYREWFANLRFPGYEKARLVESELGLIPEGWVVASVGQIVKRAPSGKKYDQKTVSETGTVPVLDQGRSGIIGYHDDEPGVLASEDAPVIVFANHTCYQRLVMFSFSAIQNVLPFTSSLEYARNIFWLHYATKDLVTFNDYKGHWPEFMAKKLILPSSRTSQQFGGVVEPLARLIFKLEKRNQILHSTRDLLLPRLISGELDVENLNISTWVPA